MRIKVLSSPSGDPKVGAVLTVSEARGKAMLRTGRVVEWTDPPEAAGVGLGGFPSEAAEAQSAEASSNPPPDARPGDKKSPTDQPEAETGASGDDSAKGSTKK